MKKRKKLTRLEKIVVRQAVTDAEEGSDFIMVDTGKRTIRIDLHQGRAILPSGKSFEIDARHIT